ncbi:hypothetical protein ABZP36_022290 [Zizania latifolia]
MSPVLVDSCCPRCGKLCGKSRGFIVFVWWDLVLQEQKEAVMAKALENNMGDVEMVSAEGSSEAAKDNKSQIKFNVKKNSRVQIKRLKGKGRKKAKNAKPPTKDEVEAMVQTGFCMHYPTVQKSSKNRVN